MLTIRLTPVGARTEQYVGGTLDTDDDLRLWAEATGHAHHQDVIRGGEYVVLPTLGNGVLGGVVVRPGEGRFVSWWVTV